MFEIARSNLRGLTDVRHAAATLARDGIQVVVLKSAHLVSDFYGNPALREMVEGTYWYIRNTRSGRPTWFRQRALDRQHTSVPAGRPRVEPHPP